MPYIAKEDRFKAVEELNNPGELNYAVTVLIQKYLGKHGLSYSTMNDIIGALEASKLEFNRRVVGPYEDKKIKKNGDVYVSAFVH
jgi:hypothetical protein